MSSTVLAIFDAVHLLAAVVWIGGLTMLVLVVIPGAHRVLKDAQEITLLFTALVTAQ
jgi:putative copper export protein